MFDRRTARRIVPPSRGIFTRSKDTLHVLSLTTGLILALGLPASAQYRRAPQPRDQARQATPTKKKQELSAQPKSVLRDDLGRGRNSPAWKYHPKRSFTYRPKSTWTYAPKRSWKYRPKRSWTYRPKRCWKYHPRQSRR